MSSLTKTIGLFRLGTTALPRAMKVVSEVLALGAYSRTKKSRRARLMTRVLGVVFPSMRKPMAFSTRAKMFVGQQLISLISRARHVRSS